MSPVLGVLVPCRNEARVIERKLANLAEAGWPALDPGRRHRIVVVDDQSSDDTIARARDAVAEHFAGRTDVAVSVLENGVRPGKPGAVATGIDHIGSEADLLVLTDADVVLEPGALEALSRAFASDPRLAMACGAQRFVRDLLEHVDASESFDRWTARVRRLESRFGRLYSVHGQLLAWRSVLGFRPRAGIAADDLDLMLQARARTSEPRRVALVEGAGFFEMKTPPGPARRAQALRRARAYVQLVRSSAPAASDALSRAQGWLYRRVPLATPFLLAAVPAALVLLAFVFFGNGAGLAGLLLCVLVLTSPPGWRLVKLARTIREASRLEEEASLPEQWDTERWTAVRL